MLCFAAGSINGTAVLACQRFVTHVTGSVTRLGVELMHWNLVLDFALVLLFFVSGAMLAGLLIQGRGHQRLPPFFSVPLWLAAAMTTVIACVGYLGWLGPFGGTVDEPGDFVFLCALSFAMGLQNAAVATSTGQLVRTTHLTGPATDLGVHLAEFVSARGPERHAALQHAALRLGKILSYAAGAAVSVIFVRLEYLALLVPAAVMVVATLLSFEHKDGQDALRAHERAQGS
jgi:uncharacterized membrane protein YoaK (UPF0700 family)